MILPTKRISTNRSLLFVGAEILKSIRNGKTISSLWEDFKKTRELSGNSIKVSYDWFVLALDILYITNLIDMKEGKIMRREK